MGRTRPRRAGWVGPLEPHAPRFATELARRGYTPSSVELHVRLAAHLSAWLDREDFGGSIGRPTACSRSSKVCSRPRCPLGGRKRAR